MASRVLNFNVGVLGHVDSGKTSLVKALSTVASTAAFDKNPQSQERGITLDLGFSSFVVDLPEHVRQSGAAVIQSDAAAAAGGGVAPAETSLHQNLSALQFTLVDCPGHASLIRTIIGGAQIIDMMLLVVDITKGIQTQTAECLIIGEILCEKMVVVLNKIDLVEESKRQSTIEKMSKKMTLTLEKTRFAGSSIVAVSANGGSESSPNGINLEKLVATMTANSYLPKRSTKGPFLLAIDHCFLIKGQGTVMTGTVLRGRVQPNDMIEIPSLQVQKKVKSMQMFKKPVDYAVQGDRIGMCVTQFDAGQLERGIACTPGSIRSCEACITTVNKIQYYKSLISSRSKYHISIGYDTVMARVTFFSSSDPCQPNSREPSDFDGSREYMYEEQLPDSGSQHCVQPSSQTAAAAGDSRHKRYFALLQFERPVLCIDHGLVIASKLDTDVNANLCRIAFHGKVSQLIADPQYVEAFLPGLRVYKVKCKTGIVERAVDDTALICRNLFKKETNIQAFVGLKVTLSTGDTGLIDGSFGKSGKFKVRVPSGLSAEAKAALQGSNAAGSKKAKAAQLADGPGSGDSEAHSGVIVTLTFKRYVFSGRKEMKQD